MICKASRTEIDEQADKSKQDGRKKNGKVINEHALLFRTGENVQSVQSGKELSLRF